MLNRLLDDLQLIHLFAESRSKLLDIVLSSSIENEDSTYMGGIRVLDNSIIVSLVNIKQSDMMSIASVLDSIANTIYVDSDKKHPFEMSTDVNDLQRPLFSNILASAVQLCTSCQIESWSSSRLTAEATLKSIKNILGNDLSGRHISVIGLGSIGFKIALYLVEEGCTVNCFSRNLYKVENQVSAINLTKSRYTIASATYATSIESAFASSSVVILSASSTSFITQSMLSVLKGKSYIFDVGKSSLSSSARTHIAENDCIYYQRVDVGSAIMSMVLSNSTGSVSSCPPLSVYSEQLHSRIVSGGFPGNPGDIVVDSAINPSFILGSLADDYSFIRNFQLYPQH